MAAQPHVGHADSGIAYHVEWDLRAEAMIRFGTSPVAPNLYPAATRLRAWLLQKADLEILVQPAADTPGEFTNPYAYHASTLALLYASVINDAHAFSNDPPDEELDVVEAELKRVRFYSEQLLTGVRFCEAAIKQLLYCTQLPTKEYERTTLGGLLTAECRGCRNSGKQRHQWSLLGSLAHRYGLCFQIDGCLIEHLKIVGRKRNLETAHSSALALDVRTVEASRTQNHADGHAMAKEFIHLLEHLADLEAHMLGELEGRPVGFVRGHR